MGLLLTIWAAEQTQGQEQSHEEHLVEAAPTDVVMKVGGMATGSIDVDFSKQSMHYLRVDNLDKKYLFVRISLPNPEIVSIGIYSN